MCLALSGFFAKPGALRSEAMPYFRRTDVDCYFEEYGSGNPFIFSHGLGGNLNQIPKQWGDLPDVRFILYDNRGHGRTPCVGDSARLTFGDMADDMAALLDTLGIPSAVVGGVSMGAGIALAFWRRHRPRGKALILSRPAWLNVPNPPNLSFAATIVDMVEKHGRERALQLFECSDAYRSPKERFPETAPSLRDLFSARSIETIVLPFRFVPASAPFESLDQLRSINVPTLVIGNHKDPVHPFEYAETLAASIPSAQLLEIPSKSDSLEEHRSRFSFCVAAFLSSIS
jgi:pimeloyl-ACP methyl ester carboxylesterase